MTAGADNLLVMGRITGIHGVHGWVKVWSYTEPREQLLQYRVWRLRHGAQQRVVKLLQGRLQGKNLVAHLEGFDDRDQSRELMEWEILVPRSELPELPVEEFYWADLEGLRVVTTDGQELGRVDHLMETGANDVLVVVGERERLIPYVPGEVVQAVDLEAGIIQVDWDPDF